MKLSTGETCRKCKPDTGACDKHLHLDPSYQANVVKPQAAKPSPGQAVAITPITYNKAARSYGKINWLTPAGVKAPDFEAAELAVMDMLAKSRRRKARRLIEVLHIIADASPESTVLGLKQMARAALRAAGEAV